MGDSRLSVKKRIVIVEKKILRNYIIYISIFIKEIKGWKGIQGFKFMWTKMENTGGI